MSRLNGVYALGTLPWKVLSGQDWRHHLAWAKLQLGMDLVIREGDFRWFLDAQTRDSHNALMQHERPVCDRLVASFLPGRTFVDVGANVGGFSVRAAKKGMKVIALEPQKEVRRVLLTNAALNDVEVKVFPYAVSDTDGLVKLEGAGGTAHVSDSGDKAVSAVRLDSVIKEPVDLLKIDVEGHELAVLRGARELLRSSRPDVYLEQHIRVAGSERCLDYLRSLGYSVEFLGKKAYAAWWWCSAIPRAEEKPLEAYPEMEVSPA